VGRVTWEAVRRALDGHAPQRVGDVVASCAAVAMILRAAPGHAGDEALELLFIRRAEHPKDPWSGQMAFPGGRAEPHDDGNLETTAVRETAEEIGIELGRSAERLGALDEVRAMARMRPLDLTIQPFVFRLREPLETRPSEEVTSVHWLPLDELLAPDARGLMDYEAQGTTLQFPCLRLHGVVIWGLTLRMLTSLAERLSAVDADAP
jgi:8-oxo-dGTP pyrophosphatase MutT (NUDIX family)